MRRFKRTLFLKILIILLLITCITVASQEKEESIYTERRENMVESQLAARDISDSLVLTAMRKVPRHEFVDARVREEAYNDYP